MKNRIGLGIATLTFLAGWGLGRHGGADPQPSGADATGPAERRTTMNSAEDRQNREMLARQTAEKFHDRKAKEVAGIFTALDPAARGPALEAWLAQLGPGYMSTSDQEKVTSLLDTWAKMDFEGAHRWADGVESASIRQLALVGLAGAIAKEQPQKAFECLISNGPFCRGIDDGRVCDLMTRLSREALAAGGDALLRLWEQLPEGTKDLSNYQEINLGAEKDTDFRKTMDAFIGLQTGDHNWPLVPGSMISGWARQDPQAATDYLAEKAGSRKISSMMEELRSVISGNGGQAAANQWTLNFFNSIPPEQLPEAIQNSGYGYLPSSLLGLLPADLSTADRTRFTAGVIQGDLNGGVPINEAFLSAIPTAEWLGVLRELRGVAQPDSVLELAKKAGASDTELNDLKERIAQPRKSRP